jgi:hypothetical protein
VNSAAPACFDARVESQAGITSAAAAVRVLMVLVLSFGHCIAFLAVDEH